MIIENREVKQLKYVYYNQSDLVYKPLPWQNLGLLETATGYGSKLTSRNMLRIGNKLHRIYVYCFSNVGTHYIIKNGEKFIISES